MFTRKGNLRFGFLILWGTVSLPIAGPAMAAQLLTQGGELTPLFIPNHGINANTWVTNGMAGYSQLIYLEYENGENYWGRPLPVQLGIANGRQLFVQSGQIEALGEYQKMLQANPRSSLANYRIAELLFNQRNYQASANCYRFALQGDGEPPWTKVWSHVQLGKIFDITNQRDRAVKEYRLAVQTNDNTLGAVTEAQQLLQKPYRWPETN
jgi:tetratricopeptide (TPR) repeat protein